MYTRSYALALLIRVQSELPAPDPVPHCLMPYVFWLDKGMVGRKRKMHPMILRPGWQPFLIRNGSGNGGGLFFGFMPIVSRGDTVALLSDGVTGQKSCKDEEGAAPFWRDGTVAIRLGRR